MPSSLPSHRAFIAPTFVIIFAIGASRYKSWQPSRTLMNPYQWFNLFLGYSFKGDQIFVCITAKSNIWGNYYCHSIEILLVVVKSLITVSQLFWPKILLVKDMWPAFDVIWSMRKTKCHNSNENESKQLKCMFINENRLPDAIWWHWQWHWQWKLCAKMQPI